LYSYNEEEAKDLQIEPCTITSKKAILVLEKLNYIEANEGMDDFLNHSVNYKIE